MKKRVNYLDVMKLIGILFIFIGHYGDTAGYLYHFVFQFHVHLFFFISGCAENFNKEKNILCNAYKKFKSIMIPFYFFAIISIVFRVLLKNDSLSFVKESLIDIAHGCIRNEFFAYSLWFFSCLFIVSLIFSLLKQLKKWYLILAFSIGLFAIFYSGIITLPQYYNIRSAFNYQLFYVIGYLSFNQIDAILNSKKTMANVFKYITGAYATGYTALLFFGKNIYSFISEIYVLNWFFQFFTAMTVIWFLLIISYFMQDISLFTSMGKCTLYFCGSEYLIKVVLGAYLPALFVTNITNGMSVIIVSIILLLLTYKFLVPIEQKALSFINKKLDLCFSFLTKGK